MYPAQTQQGIHCDGVKLILCFRYFWCFQADFMIHYILERGSLGALQSKKIPKIRVNDGSRWMGQGLTRICFGESSPNSPKLVHVY